MCPKICDFDVARSEADDSSATMTMSIGTSPYMAPEVSSGHYNHKADCFSCGCILYELFDRTKSFPLGCRHLSSSDSFFTSATPPKIQAIITSCLRENPEDRRSFLDSGSLLNSLLGTIHISMGINPSDLEDVENHV